MRRLFIVLLAVLVLMTGCSRDKEENGPLLVLRYADNQPAGHPAAEAARYFASLVEERTDGAIRVEVYLNGELGSETSIFDQLRYGGVDFSRFSIGTFPPEMGEYTALMYPYLYRDREHMWRILDGEIGDRLLEAAKEYGLIGLTWFDAGLRSLYTKEPLESMDDLSGLKIRVQENDFMSRMIGLTGAQTAQIPYGSVYSALQTDRIDGAENNIPSYVLAGHYECAQYYLVSNHMRTPELMAMSMQAEDKIASLDSDYVEIVCECARLAGQYERQLWVAGEEHYMKVALDAGCVFMYPDEDFEAQLRAAMSGMDSYMDEDELRLIEEIHQK